MEMELWYAVITFFPQSFTKKPKYIHEKNGKKLWYAVSYILSTVLYQKAEIHTLDHNESKSELLKSIKSIRY